MTTITNQKQRKGFIWSLIVIALGLLLGGLYLYYSGQDQESLNKSQEGEFDVSALEKSIAETRKNLPHEIHEGLNAIAIRYDRDSNTIVNTTAVEMDKIPDETIETYRIQVVDIMPETTSNICKDKRIVKGMREYGITYHYEYVTSKTSEPIISYEIIGADCENVNELSLFKSLSREIKKGAPYSIGDGVTRLDMSYESDTNILRFTDGLDLENPTQLDIEKYSQKVVDESAGTITGICSNDSFKNLMEEFNTDIVFDWVVTSTREPLNSYQINEESCK